MKNELGLGRVREYAANENAFYTAPVYAKCLAYARSAASLTAACSKKIIFSNAAIVVMLAPRARQKKRKLSPCRKTVDVNKANARRANMPCENFIHFKRFAFLKGFTIRHKLNLKKLLVNYLDRENVFSEIKSKVVEYEKDVDKNLTLMLNAGYCFSYELSLDFFKMQDDLRHWVLWEPDTVMEATREIVFRALDRFYVATGTESFGKKIIIRLTGLACGLDRSRFSDCSPMSLSSVRGILIALSNPYKLIRSRVYNCKSEGCPGRKGKRFGKEPSRRKCEFCFGNIHEDVSSREIGEETECLFNISKAFKDGGIHHPFTVKIKDELYPASELKLGREYVVVGKSQEHPLVALGVSERFEFHVFAKDSSLVSLPSRLSQLYLSVRKKWEFLLGLGPDDRFEDRPDVVPDFSRLHLKMGLLLGLVAKAVPILGVGSDTSVAGKLYRSAGRLADRYVSSDGFRHLGGVVRSGDRDETVWHEAGPLVIAGDGVCDLGDWTKHKKKEADYVLRTIEKGQIMLDNETDKKNYVSVLSLECSVWTFWDHPANKKNLHLLKALVDVFGIPFLIDEKVEPETGKVCSKYLHDFKDPEEEIIPEEELAEYLALVKTGPIIVTEAASELIKKYFVASRKERLDALPLGAIRTLTALSVAHARLSLRTRVLCQDVVAIVYLYQEAISDFFGRLPNDFVPKTFREPTEPAFPFQFDTVIQQFAIWLNGYVSKFASDIV